MWKSSEQDLVNFIGEDFDLSIFSLPQQVVYVCSLGVVETVCNAEVAEHFELSLLQPDFGVAEDEEVCVIGEGPFAWNHWEGHFVGQRKQDPRLICRLGTADWSLRVATKEHADLSLYDQHNVRHFIDVLVEGGGVEGVKGKDEECF